MDPKKKEGEKISPNSPTESLNQLDNLEKQILSSIQSAAAAVQELAKDKPSIKQVETHTTNFTKNLEDIENGLSRQISYLTKVATSQPHEGSNYSAQKDLQMAFHRLEHVKSRLGELDRMKLDYKAKEQTTSAGGDAPGASTSQGQLQRALTSDMPHS